MAENFDLAKLVDIMGAETAAVMTDTVNTVSSASASLGVQVSVDEILECPSVRTHIMTDGEYPLDPVRVLSELRENEAVATRLREHREDTESASAIGSYAARLNPIRRLSYGRTLADKSQARADLDRRKQLSRTALTIEEQRVRAEVNNARGQPTPAQKLAEYRRQQAAGK